MASADIGALVSLIQGSKLIYETVKSWKESRHVPAQTNSIHSQSGMVHLQGKTRASLNVQNHKGEAKAFLYFSLLEKKKFRFWSKWKTIKEISPCSEFYIECENKTALISIENCFLSIHSQFVALEDLPENFQDSLAPFMANTANRYQVLIQQLDHGEEISVVGYLDTSAVGMLNKVANDGSLPQKEIRTVGLLRTQGSPMKIVSSSRKGFFRGMTSYDMLQFYPGLILSGAGIYFLMLSLT